MFTYQYVKTTAYINR